MGCTVHRLAREHGHSTVLDAISLPEVRRGVERETGDALPGSVEETTHFRWVWGARRRVRDFRPDVVHAHLATPGLASAAAIIAGGAPLALSFQLLPETERWPSDYLVPVRSTTIIRWLPRLARKLSLVAVSASDQERLARIFPRHTLHLARNVAPPPPVIDTDQPEHDVWPEQAVKLLSVGRAHRQKGFDRLIGALSDPRLRDLDWHWAIVGDGPERPVLEMAAERGLAGRVSFLGAQPAHRLLAKAELLLSPSRWEGMPLVPMEGIAARVPVLLSRIAPHVELAGEVPGAFFPEQEKEWAPFLQPFLANAAARADLLRAQAVLLPKVGLETLWEACARVYAALLTGVKP